MNKTQQFEKKQSEMSDEKLIELATHEMCELANTHGKSHHMSIPPMITDTDMIFGELIKRLEFRLSNQTTPEPVTPCNGLTPETRQNLFDYFQQEHQIILLDGDFNEIELMVQQRGEVTDEEQKTIEFGSWCLGIHPSKVRELYNDWMRSKLTK